MRTLLARIFAALTVTLWLCSVTPAQNPTTSSYLYLSEIENTIFGEMIKFWYLDTLNGTVHSNDTIAMQGLNGQPIFLDTVSTSAPIFMYFNGANPYFAYEPVFNAPRVALPEWADSIRARAAASGCFYTDINGFYAHRLVFNSQGWMLYRWPLGLPFADTVIAVGGVPNQQTIFVDGYLELKGLVRGTVTVGAHGSNDPQALGYHCIRLLDDVRYANSNPQTGEFDPFTTDMVQIVSEGDIVIGNTPENGRDNCGGMGYAQPDMRQKSIIITAAVVALGEGFTFEDQNDSYVWEYSTGYQGPSPDHRGDIILRGSLAQHRRGYVHRSNHGDTGYGKRFYYDTRFDTTWLPGSIPARHIPEFDPPQLDFGEITVYEIDTLEVVLRNEGGTYIDIQRATTGSTVFGVFAVDSMTLAPTDSFAFQVIFQPDNIGQFNDSLIIELYYGADLKVPLVGTGAALGVTPAPLPESYALQISPNPFNGQLRIQYGNSLNPADLSIRDIQGRVVESAHLESGSYTWTPAGLAGGIYFVTLQTEGSTICRKVVYLK
jgi:hypothetical protein